MFENHKISETQNFRRLKNIFRKTLLNIFCIFVKYMNVAFQQAIGHLLTPSEIDKKSSETKLGNHRHLCVETACIVLSKVKLTQPKRCTGDYKL